MCAIKRLKLHISINSIIIIVVHDCLVCVCVSLCMCERVRKGEISVLSEREAEIINSFHLQQWRRDTTITIMLVGWYLCGGVL